MLLSAAAGFFWGAHFTIIIAPKSATADSTSPPAPIKPLGFSDRVSPVLDTKTRAENTAPNDLTLQPSTIKTVGDGKDAMPGFVTTGPTFPSGTKTFSVLIDSALAQDLKITHLRYCKEDSIIQRPNGMNIAYPRRLEMWVPPSAGFFCHTTVVKPAASEVTQSPLGVQFAKELPDGVYCLHTGAFMRGETQSMFACPFVIGGIAQLEIGSAQAAQEEDLLFTLELSNHGTGQLNGTSLVITLQKETPNFARPTFIQRWNEQVPELSAGHKTVIKRHFDSSALAPGTYYFHGHVGSAESAGDSDNYGTFDTNKFVVSPPASNATTPQPR